MPTDRAPHNMTANDTPSPYVASAYESSDGTAAETSGFEAFKAFNGADTSWFSLAPLAPPYGFEIDLGAAYRIGSYGLKAYSNLTAAPKDWKLQGSNDGGWDGTWVDLDEVVDYAFAVANTLYTFDCDQVPGAYRYFRLLMTENAGHVSYYCLNELYLYDAPAIPLAYILEHAQ